MKALRWRGAPSADDDALSRAMAMVAVPALFGLAGAWIDGRIGTGPVFLLVLAGFGLACSFASVWYRYERKMAEHDAGKPWARGSRKGTA